MKKYVIAAALALAAVMLAGCSETGKSPYEIAKELGGDGSAGEWVSQTTEGKTAAWRLYEDAKSDGYAGSFVDFLKETGCGGASIGAACMATVDVHAYFNEAGGSSFFPFGGSSEGDAYVSAGAGVIYSLDKAEGDAYIVTNYHIVYSARSAGNENIPHISDDIRLYLYGGEVGDQAVQATFLGGAMDYDIAVLRVEDSEILKNSSAMEAIPADSDAVGVGDKVYAIGNPDLGGLSVVSGVISVEAEYVNITLADESSQASMLEMRTDAPINHGNSGGGLYNERGALVGITNARSEKDGVEHFGYAIPVNLAFSVAQNIIDNSRVNETHGALRAMLGVTTQAAAKEGVYSEGTGKAYIMETVSVTEVSLGSAAFGKLKSGDVIYSVSVNGGEPKIIMKMHQIGTALFNVRFGDTVTVVLWRGDRTATEEIVFDSADYFTLYD